MSSRSRRLRGALDSFTAITPHEAVSALAEHIGCPITIGSSGSGTVSVAGVDVVITMSVKHHVAPDQRSEWMRHAYDLLATGNYWQITCVATVKERDSYVRSRHRDCKLPIAFAVVSRGRYASADSVSYRCRVHKDKHGANANRVLAVLPLSKEGIAMASKERTERVRIAAEHAARSEEERIAHDARLVGNLVAAKEIEIAAGERTCVRNACTNSKCRCEMCTPQPLEVDPEVFLRRAPECTCALDYSQMRSA